MAIGWDGRNQKVTILSSYDYPGYEADFFGKKLHPKKFKTSLKKLIKISRKSQVTCHARLNSMRIPKGKKICRAHTIPADFYNNFISHCKRKNFFSREQKSSHFFLNWKSRKFEDFEDPSTTFFFISIHIRC
jgi:hypothetical protein